MTSGTDLCQKCGRPVAQSPLGGCPACLMENISSGDDGNATNFADYQLLERLGSGGMGKVWKAKHRRLNRLVALKLIHAGRFATQTEIERFRREAEAAAALEHPNLVSIHEFGDWDGQPFFTMRLVQGKSLHNSMSREPALSPEDRRKAGLLIGKVARAVHHAHQRGVIHRDIKPSNILLDEDGEPHLADFGLAAFLESAQTLTASGEIFGSIPYMAPEQAVGKKNACTTAVDVYALGSILFELLTGKPPHSAETPAGALNQVVNSEVISPRKLNSRIDRDLETICLKCLEKDPLRRYSSAAALAEDLENWAEKRPIGARPVGPIERTIKWARRSPWKLAFGVALTAAVVGPLGIVSWFYIREIPRRSTVHHIVDRDLHGVYHLDIFAGSEDRCTLNFARQHSLGHEGSSLQVLITNVPPEMAAGMRLLIRADQAGRPDPARSPVLTNGQVFRLRVESPLDRAFYCASVGWAATNLLKIAPEAQILLKETEPSTWEWRGLRE